MAIAVNREVAGDLNNPSAELLNYCIQRHLTQTQRLERLSDYYDGEQDILKREKENDSAPNNKVLVNHAKYVVDMNVGFMVGNPIAYTSDSDKNIKPILDLYDEIDIVSHDTELEKDLSTFGIGYELVYLKINKDGTTQPTIKCIDPRGIFLVTDDTVDKNPLFAVHHQPVFNLQGGISHYLVKYYNDNRVITYKCNSQGWGEYDLIKALPHYFGAVPVIEYRNNEEKQGDFEQAMTLIDAYNLLQSDRLNDKEAFVDAIMFLQGFMLADGDGEKLMKEKLLQTSAPPSDTAAGYLTKELDETGVDVLRDSILDDIHKVTYVPNLNDENFAGNVSGESMKYKLFGLLQLMSVKSRYMIKGLRNRMLVFENFLKIKDKSVDTTGTKIKLKPNLPINTTDIINQIVQAYNAGILPLKVLLTWLPDIDDVDEVLKQLSEEKEESMKLQAKVLGVQAEDSHSDLDDDPQEDEEDERKAVKRTNEV
ncbi:MULTISPECIES: phage portal protein [unclassified Enterococcus]|uniref:phage portal protein n=1 Tax=unclassified Enterococcus TaxID=2608891 RepID=UPI001907097E|nr:MULTISPECIES: phage portal protein [unclassified Enterococcus]MBK0036689.1 phage portal protein [Enterococcus sp. S52]MBK0069352.1 phage portal protein [Enterococcus sp. S53]MBK0139945.1 phage portal protein [Enterococcus sp. S76]MBK0143596.1 phage portal protein [Enterococcus sp. S77]